MPLFAVPVCKSYYRPGRNDHRTVFGYLQLEAPTRQQAREQAGQLLETGGEDGYRMRTTDPRVTWEKGCDPASLGVDDWTYTDWSFGLADEDDAPDLYELLTDLFEDVEFDDEDEDDVD